jgi:hypothetical protein
MFGADRSYMIHKTERSRFEEFHVRRDRRHW